MFSLKKLSTNDFKAQQFSPTKSTQQQKNT